MFLMPPRQRMSSQRGIRGNIGHKKVHPFAYDSMATTFDFVPLEVRKEILFLENEGRDDPY